MVSSPYHNHRDEPYFTFLKTGKKTIEGRLRKNWYSLLKPGDYIVVHNKPETDEVKVIVRGIRNYDSFREMLLHENIENVLPGITSVDDGVQVYKKFYTPGQEKEHGVVAIEVELLTVHSNFPSRSQSST